MGCIWRTNIKLICLNTLNGLCLGPHNSHLYKCSNLLQFYLNLTLNFISNVLLLLKQTPRWLRWSFPCLGYYTVFTSYLIWNSLRIWPNTTIDFVVPSIGTGPLNCVVAIVVERSIFMFDFAKWGCLKRSAIIYSTPCSIC